MHFYVDVKPITWMVEDQWFKLKGDEQGNNYKIVYNYAWPDFCIFRSITFVLELMDTFSQVDCYTSFL